MRRLKRLQWAVRGVLFLGVSASVAANILHARPQLVSQLIAAWPPLALLLTVELISRIPVYRRALATIRVLSTITIAGIAAWVSYGHIAAVASKYGETGLVPYLLPLSVDGLVVISSICLIEIAAHLNGALSAWSRLGAPPPAAPGNTWPATWQQNDPTQARTTPAPYHAGEMVPAPPYPSEYRGDPGRNRPSAIPATPNEPTGAGDASRDEPPDDNEPAVANPDQASRAPQVDHEATTAKPAERADLPPSATTHDPDEPATLIDESTRRHGSRRRTGESEPPPGAPTDTTGSGGGEATTDLRAAVAYWRAADPTLRAMDIAAKLHCSRRTVNRYWNLADTGSPDAAQTPEPPSGPATQTSPHKSPRMP